MKTLLQSTIIVFKRVKQNPKTKQITNPPKTKQPEEKK